MGDVEGKQHNSSQKWRSVCIQLVLRGLESHAVPSVSYGFMSLNIADNKAGFLEVSGINYFVEGSRVGHSEFATMATEMKK